jgi:CBS-domain-containing membrane protein
MYDGSWRPRGGGPVTPKDQQTTCRHSVRHFRRENFLRFLLQCSLAGLVVLVLLLVLDAVTQTVLIAALGSTAFIAFAIPRSRRSNPRHLIGGYLVGMASGTLMSLLHYQIGEPGTMVFQSAMVGCGALAISLAMFGMVVMRTEHAPAAALALGLVLNHWDPLTLAVVLIGVTVVSLVKQLILPLLIDLI